VKSPIFNNIRWGEFSGWLVAISSILSALALAPIPSSWKPWIELGISVLAFVLAYLRNPKSLDWVDEAQAVGAAYKQAQEYPED
jgi:hypothetical protein